MFLFLDFHIMLSLFLKTYYYVTQFHRTIIIHIHTYTFKYGDEIDSFFFLIHNLIKTQK